MKKITACIGAILAVLGCSAFAFQGMAVRFSHWDEFKNIEQAAESNKNPSGKSRKLILEIEILDHVIDSLN